MEDQLRTTLIDLERREKKLAISEHEVRYEMSVFLCFWR